MVCQVCDWKNRTLDDKRAVRYFIGVQSYYRLISDKREVRS